MWQNYIPNVLSRRERTTILLFTPLSNIHVTEWPFANSRHTGCISVTLFDKSDSFY